MKILIFLNFNLKINSSLSDDVNRGEKGENIWEPSSYLWLTYITADTLTISNHKWVRKWYPSFFWIVSGMLWWLTVAAIRYHEFHTKTQKKKKIKWQIWLDLTSKNLENNLNKLYSHNYFWKIKKIDNNKFKKF